MPGKQKVEFSGEVAAQEAAQYLESLARGLRERSMLLESGDTSITLEVPEDVKIELNASSDAEKGKAGIEISVGWRKREEVADEAPPPGLLIVAGAQAAEAAELSE